MSRIKLLQAAEIKVFNSPPVFNPDEQQYFFSMDKALAKEIARLRHPMAKVGFLLQWGYFKAVGRFFEVADFRLPDLSCLLQRLEVQAGESTFETHYNKQMAYHHRERILALTGWQPFDQTFFGVSSHENQPVVLTKILPPDKVKLASQTKEALCIRWICSTQSRHYSIRAKASEALPGS